MKKIASSVKKRHRVCYVQVTGGIYLFINTYICITNKRKPTFCANERLYFTFDVQFLCYRFCHWQSSRKTIRDQCHAVKKLTSKSTWSILYRQCSRKTIVINVVQPKCSRKNIRDQFHTGKAHVQQYVINAVQPKCSLKNIRIFIIYYTNKAHVKQ